MAETSLQGSGSAPPPPPPQFRNSVPFEEPGVPFLERYIQTVKLAFAEPGRLFSGMADTNIGPALLYGVINGTILLVFTIVWQMLFGGMLAIFGEIHLGELAIGTGVYILVVLLSPIFFTIGLFVSSGLYHVSLLIFGDGNRGFAVTFKAVAYGQTPNLLAVVPICGGFAAGIWSLVLMIMGGKIGHDTETWKAILAYFLPTIVCCCLMFWALSTFGLLGALAH